MYDLDYGLGLEVVRWHHAAEVLEAAFVRQLGARRRVTYLRYLRNIKLSLSQSVFFSSSFFFYLEQRKKSKVMALQLELRKLSLEESVLFLCVEIKFKFNNSTTIIRNHSYENIP